MASPHVAGVLSLMFSRADSGLILNYKDNPSVVALKFKEWLLAGVDKLDTLKNITL